MAQLTISTDVNSRWKHQSAPVLLRQVFIFILCSMFSGLHCIHEIYVGASYEFQDIGTAITHALSDQSDTEAVIKIDSGTYQTATGYRIDFGDPTIMPSVRISKLTIESSTPANPADLFLNSSDLGAKMFYVIGTPDETKEIIFCNLVMRGVSFHNGMYGIDTFKGFRNISANGCEFSDLKHPIRIYCAQPWNGSVDNISIDSNSFVGPQSNSSNPMDAVFVYFQGSQNTQNAIFNLTNNQYSGYFEQFGSFTIQGAYTPRIIIENNQFCATFDVHCNPKVCISYTDVPTTIVPFRLADNRFVNGSVQISGLSGDILDNRFYMEQIQDYQLCLSGTHVSDQTINLSGNAFMGQGTSAVWLNPSTSSGPSHMSVSFLNNSFINVQTALKVLSSNLIDGPSAIPVFRNNLIVCAGNPIETFLNGNPVVYNPPIEISHSIFQNGLPTNQSLDVDLQTCFAVDPLITLDPDNQGYLIRWNSTERSPLIMAGYSEFGSPYNMDKLDIGAVQYQELPHAYRTYTFPPYSVRNGLKWMSFPTIDRLWNPVTNDPDVASTFFDPIINHDVLQSIDWKVQDDPAQSISYEYGNWLGDQSHLVIPQQGYKIQMAQGLTSQEYISVPGLIPAVEDFPLMIKAQAANKADEIGNENWLGYFNPETSQAREAFEEVIDNLWFIQTQNWTMCREEKIPDSPWIYALQNGKDPTLSYGDMVVVKCFEDDDFVWNAAAMSQIAIEKELPSHFVYEEKADYVPVYVELEGTDLPTELALFVDDVCQGAVVVTDSLVEIPAYVVNNADPNAEVQIRAYYEGKSTTDFIPQYRVWDQNSGAYLDTHLSLKNKNYYYKVRLVQSEQDTPPLAETELKVYPNPFNPNTTIKFNLTASTDVKLEIYNQRGQLVRILVNELVQAGEHSISWDGKDDKQLSLASGLYYAKLSYQNKSTSKKMVLIKSNHEYCTTQSARNK